MYGRNMFAGVTLTTLCIGMSVIVIILYIIYDATKGIPRLILHNTDNKVSQCLHVARSVETDLVVDWSVLYSQSYHSRIRKIRRWVKGSVVTLH